MTAVSWSQVDGVDCLLISGGADDADVQVRPDIAARLEAGPPMAGHIVRRGGNISFIPRFPFVDGTNYSVAVNDVVLAVLRRSFVTPPATTEVIEVYPSTADVPLNLLRLYIWFSAPMREGCAAEHVHLFGEEGDPLRNAFLPRCVHVIDALDDRRRLPGVTTIGEGERTWRFTPDHAWQGRPHLLVVDPVLEDSAGNSVARVFDRDLARREDDPATEAGLVNIPFTPGP